MPIKPVLLLHQHKDGKLCADAQNIYAVSDDVVVTKTADDISRPDVVE